MYGIKFDNATGTNLHFSLDTKRAPKWGDIFFKGGSFKDCNNVKRSLYAYNSGFGSLDIDPLTLPQNGSIDGQHMLVPDTVTGDVGDNPVPEPLTALGMMLGVGGLVRYVRRAR